MVDEFSGPNLFIAVSGISSGPIFVSGVQAAGMSLFLWRLFATFVPVLPAPLMGECVFRFGPAIDPGCCGGAWTSAPSVGMSGEAAEKNVPVPGSTVFQAVSDTPLTLWGMVLSLLVAR